MKEDRHSLLRACLTRINDILRICRHASERRPLRNNSAFKVPGRARLPLNGYKLDSIVRESLNAPKYPALWWVLRAGVRPSTSYYPCNCLKMRVNDGLTPAAAVGGVCVLWGGRLMWGDGGRSLSACWLSSLEHLPLRLEQMRRRGRGHAGSPGFLPGCRRENSQKPAQRCGFQILVRSFAFFFIQFHNFSVNQTAPP